MDEEESSRLSINTALSFLLFITLAGGQAMSQSFEADSSAHASKPSSDYASLNNDRDAYASLAKQRAPLTQGSFMLQWAEGITTQAARFYQREILLSVSRDDFAVPARFYFPPYKARELEQVSGAASASSPQAAAGSDSAELAKKLSNPISSMISVPFQTNCDFGMGPFSHGFRFSMNIQPVIPFELNEHWNLISRTILPIIHQNDVVFEGSTETGLGDITQSFFFSPNKTEPLIMGFGPVFLIPTATDHLLG